MLRREFVKKYIRQKKHLKKTVNFNLCSLLWKTNGQLRTCLMGPPVVVYHLKLGTSLTCTSVKFIITSLH